MTDRLRLVLLCVVVFLGSLPVLAWHDFRDVMENFLVVTADEVVRDGTWAVPTLGGVSRLQKPPLAHWTTAVGLLLRDWGVQDEVAARLPSLIMAIGAVPAVYLLGDWLLGKGGGLPAATVFASSYFFLKYNRRAGYDPQLVFWTAWATVGLVWAVVRGAGGRGCVLAGACLGLGFLTKGPPALVTTVVPVAVTAALCRWTSPRPPAVSRTAVLWVGLGAAVFLVTGLSWYVAVALGSEGAVGFWTGQATLRNERQLEGLSRVESLPNLATLVIMTGVWTVWFFVGAIRAVGDAARFRRAGWENFGLVMIVVVPVVMVAAAPLRERYLFPLVVGGALTAAWGILGLGRVSEKLRRGLVALHWLAVGGLALAAGVGCALFFEVDGVRVLPWWAGAGVSVLGVGAAVWGWRTWRGQETGRGAGLLVTAAVVVLCSGAYLWCDQFTPGGRSVARVAAERFAKAYPDARYVFDGRNNSMPLEFNYYLGRTVHVTDDVASEVSSAVPTLVLVDRKNEAAFNTRFPEALKVDSYTHRSGEWGLYLMPFPDQRRGGS